jgi:hypothetical protein
MLKNKKEMFMVNDIDSEGRLTTTGESVEDYLKRKLTENETPVDPTEETHVEEPDEVK